MGTLDTPLLPVVSMWVNKLRAALEFKARRFGPDADEGMKFFAGPYNFLYTDNARRTDKHFSETKLDDDADDGEIPAPRFKMTCNKVAELVQIFGPNLYHKNPQRTVTPREVVLPDADVLSAMGSDPAAALMLQQQLQGAAAQRAIDKFRAKLLSAYMNFTPNALDLKTEARKVIDEALIKGMGTLWTEPWVSPTGMKMVGSFFASVDDLLLDPDMPTIESGKWCARRRIEPVWEVERRFALKPGTLHGATESVAQQAAVAAHPDGDYWRKQGQTNDLLTYWEVYSKTGIGGRLTGIDPWVKQELEFYGDYCYLAIAEGHAHPLNVPSELWDLPESQARQEIARRVQWATPYWADGEWPFTPFYFHAVPGEPWPMSHIAPGMGELKFLNWAYSILAGKMRVACRDFIAILEEAGEDIVSKVLHGADYELIRIKGSHGKTIDQVVQFLQHPTFNGDIWRVVDEIANQFERRVGLNELLYGESSRQLRSAAEAEMKSSQVNIRPDDMANKIEDAMSAVARKEAIAIRWHLSGQDVQPILGPFGAMMWDRFVTPANPAELWYSLDYRIEAGSIRKPNRERDAANVKDAMQTLMPFYQNLAMQGLVGPFNELLEKWGQTIDMKVDKLKLPEPQMMGGPGVPPPQPGPGGPPPRAA